MPATEHFRNLQIKHWVMQPHMQQAATRALLPIEKFAESGAGSKGCISFLYALIQSLSPRNTPRYRSVWENLLDTTPGDKQWERLFRDVTTFNRSMHTLGKHIIRSYTTGIFILRNFMEFSLPPQTDAGEGVVFLGTLGTFGGTAPVFSPSGRRYSPKLKLS